MAAPRSSSRALVSPKLPSIRRILRAEAAGNWVASWTTSVNWNRMLSQSAFDQQQKVNYSAAAMILDVDDPSKVIARSDKPLLAPETDDEKSGTVPNVVFPTAIEEIAGQLFVFYGMADSKIGVARLDRI